jgi:hypothetical protein
MKNDAVVKTFRDELLDPRNVIGRKIGTKLDDDRSFGRLKRQGVGGVSHSYSSSREKLRASEVARSL